MEPNPRPLGAEERISDGRVLALVDAFLRQGVMEEGRLREARFPLRLRLRHPRVAGPSVPTSCGDSCRPRDRPAWRPHRKGLDRVPRVSGRHDRGCRSRVARARRGTGSFGGDRDPGNGSERGCVTIPVDRLGLRVRVPVSASGRGDVRVGVPEPRGCCGGKREGRNLSRGQRLAGARTMSLPVQTKEDVIARLCEARGELAALGVTEIGLFGSFVSRRQTEQATSTCWSTSLPGRTRSTT